MNYYIIIYFGLPSSLGKCLVEEKIGPYETLWKAKLAAWWKRSWDERWTMTYEIEPENKCVMKKVGDIIR